MKTITEPKVYLVGRQAIAVGVEGGSPGLLNFLHDHDIDDQYFFNMDGDPAEELAETAGRPDPASVPGSGSATGSGELRSLVLPDTR